MKKLFLVAFLLMVGVATAHAAIVVDLVGGTGDNLAETVFAFSNLDATTTFDSGATGSSAVLRETNISGASGSVTVTWTATTASDALAWSFDTVGVYEIRDYNTGWGISTLNDVTAGAGNLQTDEAFVLTFNTSNLTLSAEQRLVFSVSTRDTGDTLHVYKRTGSGSGSQVLDEATTAATFSTPVPVGGLNEFAIIQPDGGNLVCGFSIDVIGEGAPAASGWRVIPEDVDYPTDDIIVAFCEVTDPVYNLPVNTTNTDCTAAFQAALNDASAAGGGTVFVPKGEYRIEGTLTFDHNVVLRGRWCEITSTNQAAGTILSLYNTGTNAIINLSANGCGVRDLTFWHPEQIPHATSPTVYPFVIYGLGSKTTIENITLVNAYNGVDMSKSSMCCVRGVYGSPLHTGLTADNSAAVSRFDSLHFSPDYWAWSELPGSPALDGVHASYMMDYGTAVDIREMDGFYFVFSNFSGYNKGLVLRAGVSTDDPWGSMAYITSTNCRTAMVVEEAKWIKMVGCTFQGSDKGIDGGNDSSIALIMNGCAVSGVVNSVALQNGSAHLVNCALTGPTSATGDARIIEESNVTPVPRFNNVYDKVRKPTHTDLFNVKDYGAVGDGVINDTVAIQQAVAAAVTNGGGIVFVPDGEYLMTGNLNLGVGVELRGNSGGRHDSDTRAELGSLILIDIGKNQPDGTPFITLGDTSGLRGISFFYPDQNYTDDNAYDAFPYMVQANGDKNYIIDCFAGNAYQAAELNGDDHLVEYTFFGGLRSTYRANNCSGGRIQNCHIKPDFWRDTHLPGNPSENYNLGPFKWDIGKELEAIYLNGCTHYSIMGIFNHASHELLTVDNSSGQSMMVAAEQVQHGITVKNGSQPFDFIMTGATVNNIGDYTGQYGIKTLSGYTGFARFFTGYHWGTSEEALASEGGYLYLQQCDIGGFKRKGAMNFSCGTNGAMTLESCTSDVFFGVDNEGSLTMKDCDFRKGLLNSAFQEYGADNQFDAVCVVADLNEDPPGAYGLELDTNHIVMVEAAQETVASLYPTEGDARRNMAARLSSGTAYELDVTDPEFSNGAKRNVRFEILVMVSNAIATIDVFYDNGGADLKFAKSTPVDATGVNIKWQTIWVTVFDAQFGAADQVDIRIETSDPSATILDMVAITSTDLPNLQEDDMDYDVWSKVYGGAGLIGSETYDYDRDGMINLLEYALNGNPVNAADSGEDLEFGMVGNAMNMVHVQRNNDPALSYVVETTTNFVEGSWSADPSISMETNSTGTTFDYVINSIPLIEANKFIRLNVEIP